MKILFIKSFMHHKNLNFILKCKQIEFHIVNNVNEMYDLNLHDYDAVYSPCQPVYASNYPYLKFIFGPHFSITPLEHQMKLIKSPNTVYLQPSNWARDVWVNNPLCDGIKVVSQPFGVDTERFKDIKPIVERDQVFIYYKSRRPEELELVENFLKSKNINYRVFSYRNRYDENEYINYLQNSKFGFWLDAHESQGFALQEALSCNVPLLVWNITSMNQEYGQNYPDIPATTIPYWDEKCGEFFYNSEELEKTFDTFMSKINDYKPRDYILENLSIKMCEQKFMNLVNSIV